LIISAGTLAAWGINLPIQLLVQRFDKQSFTRPLSYILSYFLSIITIIGATRMLRLGMYTQSFTPVMEPGHFPTGSAILGFSINSVILILQNLTLLREKKAIAEIENARLKLRDSEAAIQQLKQQLQPHFLFNSLNTLKTLIHNSPDSAEEYLVKLSGFLRTSLSSGTSALSSVSEELRFCLDYLDMQKIRYGEALTFSADIKDVHCNSGFIPAFSLQLLAENAIKHNALTTEFPLQVRIISDDDRIIVSNNIRKKSTTENSNGLGLVNLAERYRILSGDDIIIKNSESVFSVSIKVLNHENNNNRR
jgi:LytS/YehU family sensor histidine kinase